MSIVNRIIWLLVTRPRLKKIGSMGHWLSFIDKKSTIEGGNKFGKFTNIVESHIGRNTYVPNASICLSTVGAFCSIGPQVNIGGLGSHPTNWLSTHPSFYSTRGQSGAIFTRFDVFDELKKTTIGNDVWIGARVLVIDGVNIGDGAIIASGAVVTKDVPPFAIFGGVPARLIRYRFSPDVIECLIRWKWWLLPDEVLVKLAGEFCKSHEWTPETIMKLEERSIEFLSLLKTGVICPRGDSK